MRHDAQPVSGKGTLMSYATGFTLSILLTVAAFLAVIERILSGKALVAAIFILAVFQLLVQLLFFLHLGQESRPRWNLMVFLFMILVLLIVVIGTLWIMDNLSYHMMSPDETNQHIEHEEAIYR